MPCVVPEVTQRTPDGTAGSHSVHNLGSVTATPPPVGRRAAFESALLSAITEGRFTSRTDDLGQDTRSVLLAIAYHHPEASPNLIADAYDAFGREHYDDDERLTVM